MKSIETVIIQAGGQGSRMGSYTHNKPKCLIPYMGKTILENNLNYFKGKKIIIIVDYLSEVLINYVNNILKRNDIIFIKSKEKTTTSGLYESMSHISDDEKFLLIWSDLYLKKEINVDFNKEILIGLTNEFTCRWKFKDNQLVKEKTNSDGILGIFAFKNKKTVLKFSENLSLVGGNLTNINVGDMEYSYFQDIEEIGDFDRYESLISESSKSRFFNKLTINEDVVVKECIDENYKNLISDEIDWYKFLDNKINFIPKIISENPFVMTRIKGSHLFNLNLNESEKKIILDSVFENMNKLHSLGVCDSNIDDINEIYINKTFKRVNDVHYVIPFFKDEYIEINGNNYLNPFSDKNISFFRNQLEKIDVKKYNVIHGDITFSNLLVDGNKTYFIDPRGYFGNSKIYGDKDYDWAKLYYSVNGNYDSINQKKFTVSVHNKGVTINIKSNGFEDFSSLVIESSGISYYHMELLHSLIWLSLTGYVREDIDSILYSFYNGVMIWNRTLK